MLFEEAWLTDVLIRTAPHALGSLSFLVTMCQGWQGSTLTGLSGEDSNYEAYALGPVHRGEQLTSSFLVQSHARKFHDRAHQLP